MNDIAFIERLKNKDGAAFSQLVEERQQLVYNTALGILQNEEDAEEVTQDVFISVYENLSSFKAEAQLNTWIYRIAVNKSLDAEKKKKRQKSGGFLKRIFDREANEEAVHFDHPGVLLDQKENAAALFAALKKLPTKQRTAFILQKMEGQPNKEIATIMEINETAVESLLARAKNNLRNTLALYFEKESSNDK